MAWEKREGQCSHGPPIGMDYKGSIGGGGSLGEEDATRPWAGLPTWFSSSTVGLTSYIYKKNSRLST